jgi:putative zinc finger/helix-turn-helix YgiT family protein
MPREDHLRPTKPADLPKKPFPRRCPECGKAAIRAATIPYDVEVKHDGRLHRLHIAQLQVNQCGSCGEVLFSNATDDQVTQALREHLVLLTPEQIRGALGALGMMQKDFAEHIGVAAETVSRWMSGTQIQSRAMDNLMRLFFAFDTVRVALPAPHPDKNLGVNAVGIG